MGGGRGQHLAPSGPHWLVLKESQTPSVSSSSSNSKDQGQKPGMLGGLVGMVRTVRYTTSSISPLTDIVPSTITSIISFTMCSSISFTSTMAYSRFLTDPANVASLLGMGLVQFLGLQVRPNPQVKVQKTTAKPVHPGAVDGSDGGGLHGQEEEEEEERGGVVGGGVGGVVGGGLQGAAGRLQLVTQLMCMFLRFSHFLQ